MHVRILQHVTDMKKEQRGGQHAALGDVSVYGHIIRAETIDRDLDVELSEKTGNLLA